MRINNPQLSAMFTRRLRQVAVSAVCTFGIIGASAQDISQIGKSDPLIITGSIGTQNTYYHTSMGAGYMSPLSNSVYANLNIRIYGFSMPFSFYYTNNNTSFSYPQFSFNISPSYKDFTAHIGQSSMPFSTYVMNMSFNGVGLEYKGKKFRTSAFYGVLKSAVNDNPEDPNPRKPQYRRIGWGFSAGYGSGRKSIDVYFLRAYDQESSINELYRETYRPQENLVVGVKGSYAIKNFLSFHVNAATSAFTADTESQKVTVGQATKYDGIFQPRYTTILRFAGDASLAFTTKWFNTSLYYKIIQPDYTSLGTYYTSNNYHSLGATFGTTLFKRITLSANFSLQKDNLTKKQLYTTKGYVYSGMAGFRITDNFNINAMYNGYLQDQADGTVVLNDTVRVHRILHSVSLLPSIVFQRTNLDHSFSLSGNYTTNKDLNIFSIGMSDVKTLALGASYTLNVKPWDTNFSFNYSHQQSEGFETTYLSDVGSFTTGRSFLKDNNLSTSATVSICYNEVKKTSKNLSMALDLSANYTLKKAHSFSFSASFSKYGDVNLTKTKSSLDGTDIRLTMNYVYTFTLLEIKRKAKEKK